MAGAARAWRPLLRGSGMMVARLWDQMATAFAATGDADLAERVDERAMALGELNGVSMAHVRAAERALASGEGRARALAARVLDAWSTADERPPSMARMAQIRQEPPARADGATARGEPRTGGHRPERRHDNQRHVSASARVARA